MQLPMMIKGEQLFENPRIENIETKIEVELDRILLQEKIKPGSRIALTAGSRGIARIPVILKCCVEKLRHLGAQPYIVPAMGSHGGATADGQLSVLKHLGITEETMGVPIKSSMEVCQIGTTPSGYPVYIDRHAWEADGIFVVNRIKAHTAMYEDIESGLMKMISIGLGKEKGCSLIHACGLGQAIPEIAREVILSGKILGGLAVVENSSEEIAELMAVRPEEMEAIEKKLLVTAKKLIPTLPFDQFDILIIDEIGKNISGTGMDTKVIGRFLLPHLPEPTRPRINLIVVLDLSQKTGGNAMGVGLADLTTRKLVDKIDYLAMYKNSQATGYLNRAKIPMTMENDREAIELALKTSCGGNAATAKIVRIRNTLEIKELFFSEALADEAISNPLLRLLSSPQPISFDAQGNLL